jgi:hypothetical protein
MNDFESKLRSLTFREPPPGWRGSIVSAGASARDWRSWLAPHPAAWAGLAAIWLVLALVSRSLDKPSATTAVTVQRGADAPSAPTLFALQLRAAPGLEPPL